MTDRQQVLMFAKQHGLHVNGKGGIPLIAKLQANRGWMKCFDDWADAKRFLHQAHIDRQDLNKPYPWMA